MPIRVRHPRLSLVAQGEAGDEVMSTGQLRGLLHITLGGAAPAAQGNVVLSKERDDTREPRFVDRVLEENGLLAIRCQADPNAAQESGSNSRAIRGEIP